MPRPPATRIRLAVAPEDEAVRAVGSAVAGHDERACGAESASSPSFGTPGPGVPLDA